MLGGSLPDALLPAYTNLTVGGRDDEARRLTEGRSGSIPASLLRSAPRFTPLPRWRWRHLPPRSMSRSALALDLFRLLLPFSLFYGLSHVFASLLQARKHFALAAAAPAIVPAATALSLLLLGGIEALVTGVVVGSMLHALVLALGVRRACGSGVFRPTLGGPEARRVWLDTVPLLGGAAIMHGAILIDSGMAAWLPSGAVASLGYAEKVCGVLLAVAATAVGQAMFPYLSEQVAARDWQGLRRTIRQFSGWIAAASIPVVAVAWVAAPLAVAALFERGEFTAADTERVAGILRFYALQTPFYVAAVLASRVVMALRAPWFMLATTVVNLSANAALNYALMGPYGERGIALSTACVYALSAAMLYAWLFRKLRAREAADPARRAA
ncbi:MAG: lipid II flippase MurJ [Verrucomicrobiales bacterium]